MTTTTARKRLKCPECGALFFRGSNAQKFCSSECTEKHQQKLKKEKEIKVEVHPSRVIPRLSISEVVRRARAEGLSYGKYVAKYKL